MLFASVSLTRPKSILASVDEIFAITQALKFVARMAARLTVQIIMDAGVLDVVLRIYIRVLLWRRTHCAKRRFLSRAKSLAMYVAAAPPAEHSMCILWMYRLTEFCIKNVSTVLSRFLQHVPPRINNDLLQGVQFYFVEGPQVNFGVLKCSFGLSI